MSTNQIHPIPLQIHKKVYFQNQIFWLHSTHCGMYEYNLSPLNHYDENGILNLEVGLDGISYAIIQEGIIIRYGKKIGVFADLIDVINDEVTSE